MESKKLVQGIGINDANYAVQKFELSEVNGVQKRRRVWICPYYRTWGNMLDRCYSIKRKVRYPTYKGCSVSKEWVTFSNFKAWMETQNFEGMQLDKDLLVKGNKVYGPETCVFVSPMVNSFTTDSGAARGKWMVGVSWHKPTEKFLAKCSNPFTKEYEHLGLFSCEVEAHQAWVKRKLELAHKLAAIQTDTRVAKALIDRYMNYSS